MPTNLTNSEIVGCALRGEDAQTTTGNMSTDSYRVGFSRFTPYVGYLPKPWRHVLSEAFNAGRISQVIYSYSTPIAWHDSRYGWIVPDVSYSPTTSTKHQPHLYRLGVPSIAIPYDATDEDAQRVLDGKMIFCRSPRNGRTVTHTIPGPNYIEGE